MADLADWFDPYSPGGILAVVFGFIVVLQLVEFLTTLAATAPLVAGLVVAVAFLGVCMVVAARYGTFDTDDATDDDPHREETDSDPVAVLKRRYAEGELSEAEFERRIDTLLDTDGTDALNRELETA